MREDILGYIKNITSTEKLETLAKDKKIERIESEKCSITSLNCKDVFH